MDFDVIAAECAPGVAPSTLAAVVRTESGFRPLTIGVNGGNRLTRQPQNLPEAVATARWLIEHGYNIDLGLGQINSSNLARTGLSLEAAFDPCRNVAAAATILQSNYVAASRRTDDSQTALRAALSAYNTGSFSRGYRNGYVQKVVSNAHGGNAVSAASMAPSTASAKGSKRPVGKLAKMDREMPRHSKRGSFVSGAMEKSADDASAVMVYSAPRFRAGSEVHGAASTIISHAPVF